MARQRKHDTKEMIDISLKAAEKLIVNGGLSGLSGRKVASEIDYTVGSLYSVFENLDDLVLQVSGRTLDAMKSAMEEATKDCASPEKCIEAMAHAYVDYAAANKGLWMAVFEHNQSEGSPLPHWYTDKVDKMFGLVEDQLGDLPGLSKNESSEVAKTLWSGVHGICVLAATRKYEAANVENISPLVDGLISNYLAGLQMKLRSSSTQ